MLKDEGINELADELMRFVADYMHTSTQSIKKNDGDEFKEFAKILGKQFCSPEEKDKVVSKIRAVWTIVEEQSPHDGRNVFSRWLRTGTGYVNHDGSMNIMLDVLPLNGKLHIADLEQEKKGDRDD